MTASETTIDGLRVTAHSIPPVRAYPMTLRVARILAGGIGRLDLAALKGGQVPTSWLLHVVDLLAADEALVPDLLAHATVTHDGERVDLVTSEDVNRVFRGRTMTMFRVAVEVARFNFGDFFADVFSAPAPAVETTPAPTETTSETAST